MYHLKSVVKLTLVAKVSKKLPSMKLLDLFIESYKDLVSTYVL